MDNNEKSSGFILFGRDVLKIPCYRTTFLYSISSWVGVSLLTFLLTSKPTLASHMGFASFMVVTFGTYTTCRINYANQVFTFGQIQGGLHKAAVMEGTQQETNPDAEGLVDA